MTYSNKPYRRGSVVWPVVLICLGGVFLLTNLGILSGSVWPRLFQLWPLLFVAIGIDLLLGRRSGIFAGFAALLIFGMFAAGYAVVQATGQVWSGEQYTRPISHPLDGVQQASVDINFSVGELNISASDQISSLIEGEIDVADAEVIDEDFNVTEGHAFFKIKSEGIQYYPSWLFGENNSHKTWDILLNPSVPYNIELRTGVGQATLDFRGLELTDLRIDSGVGQTIVYLAETGDYKAHISAGVGELIVYVPAGIAVRLHLDKGLGNTSVSISGSYYDDNSILESSGYSDAENRIEIFASSGVGDLRIIQLSE